MTKKHLVLVYEYRGGGTPTRHFFLTLYIFVVTVVTKARKALFYKDFEVTTLCLNRCHPVVTVVTRRK